MPKPDTEKSEGNEAAQASRERELQELIKRAEQTKGGSLRPSNESPHDFVERRMREKFKK